MNIQFPLAGLLAQQEKASSGTAAEGQSGTSFADILGQATQAGEQAVAALPVEQALAVLPKGGELPGLSFHQSLSLPVELTEEIEPELLPEIVEPELQDQLTAEEGVAVAALTNSQAVPLAEGQVAAATATVIGEQVKAAQRVAPEQAQIQQAAQLQVPNQGKAQPVDAAFNLNPEQLEVASKPITQSTIESSALVSGNNVQQASAPAVARAVLNAPMASPQWQNDLSQQVSSFVMRGDSRVSLQLNPAELGPLLVEMKVVEQNAQLQFMSAQAAVRSAVEQAIPQLRDALAQQGIDLGDVNVGEQSAQQEYAQSTRSGFAGTADELEADEGESVQVELDTASALPGQLSVYA